MLRAKSLLVKAALKSVLGILRRNINLNGITNIEVIEAAVSDERGAMEFVRVIGNTTSSHLAGAKKNAYGLLERFPVRVESIEDVMHDVDFIKMDAEGQEKAIILASNAKHWERTDMIVEVGSEENAIAIYEHLNNIGINLFSQKNGWRRVIYFNDMPTRYKHGSLFISSKLAMPWH